MFNALSLRKTKTATEAQGVLGEEKSPVKVGLAYKAFALAAALWTFGAPAAQAGQIKAASGWSAGSASVSTTQSQQQYQFQSQRGAVTAIVGGLGASYVRIDDDGGYYGPFFWPFRRARLIDETPTTRVQAMVETCCPPVIVNIITPEREIVKEPPKPVVKRKPRPKKPCPPCPECPK